MFAVGKRLMAIVAVDEHGLVSFSGLSKVLRLRRFECHLAGIL